MLLKSKVKKVFYSPQKYSWILFLVFLGFALNHYFEISKNLLDPESSKIIDYKNYFVVLRGMNIPAVVLLV